MNTVIDVLTVAGLIYAGALVIAAAVIWRTERRSVGHVGGKEWVVWQRDIASAADDQHDDPGSVRSSLDSPNVVPRVTARSDR
jgi:hypothetical protein